MERGTEIADPVGQLEAAIAAVGEVGLGAFTAHGRAEFLKSVERAGRRFAALQTAQVDLIDRDGLYGADGHWSAAVWANPRVRDLLPAAAADLNAASRSTATVDHPTSLR